MFPDDKLIRSSLGYDNARVLIKPFAELKAPGKEFDDYSDFVHTKLSPQEGKLRDREKFEKIKEEYLEFLKKIEKIEGLTFSENATLRDTHRFSLGSSLNSRISDLISKLFNDL